MEGAEKRLDPGAATQNGIAFGTPPGLATGIVPAAVGRGRATHATTTLRVVEKNRIDWLRR